MHHEAEAKHGDQADLVAEEKELLASNIFSWAGAVTIGAVVTPTLIRTLKCITLERTYNINCRLIRNTSFRYRELLMMERNDCTLCKSTLIFV